MRRRIPQEQLQVASGASSAGAGIFMDQFASEAVEQKRRASRVLPAIA